MKILVVNCGSSSIKYCLYTMPERQVLARGMLERIGDEGTQLKHVMSDRELTIPVRAVSHREGMELILKTLSEGDHAPVHRIDEIAAVGHRVVHGGEAFTGSVLIDEEVLATIEKMADLAPLHNPPNLVGIQAAQSALPDIPHVACFDTAFHASIPPVAYLYALPYELYERFGIRRYGFHGSSHRYVAQRAAELLGRGDQGINCITCHLGNGCSMAAVRQGQCVDTSMGLTPLEGLVMGTRTGDFDPAILFYLADKGYDWRELNDLCNKKSGLLGISGSSNDVRTLTERAASGDQRAQLALDIFAYRVKKYVGAYAAALGSIDALVFTGGIGENAVSVRAACCSDLDQLGIHLDERRNKDVVGCEGAIQSESSRSQVLVIPTDEEGVIARDTYELTASSTAAGQSAG